MPTATSTAFAPAGGTTSTSSPNLSPLPPALPAGSTFDILPPTLHALTTLLASPSLLQPTSSLGHSDHVTNNGTLDTNGVNSGAGASATFNVTGPIDPTLRDLPDLLTAAKQRIQNAKAVVARLPDVDRNLSQQEAEIRSVERRIERLKEAWHGVQEAATKALPQTLPEAAAANTAENGEAESTEADVKMEDGQ